VIEPRIREATLDDAELAADLMTASYPALAQDPVITRYRWEHPRDGYAVGRYIAEHEGRPIAFLDWIHGPWEKLPDRHSEVDVSLDPRYLDQERLAFLYRWLETKVVEEGAKLVLAYCLEDMPVYRAVFEELGYERERSEKVWELDLKAEGTRLKREAVETERKARAGGITLTTLAAWQHPRKLEKLYELDERTRHDIPHTLPILSETFEDFKRRTGAPDRPADRYWIALDGDLPVALSYLRFPPIRGSVWTGYTCAHPDYRGRGLARAIKLQSLAQAVDLEIPFVYTDNDSENAPMLHINEQLGYQRRPGFIGHLKRVDTKVNA